MRMGNRQIPKPLVEVGDRPILWHVMKIYAAQGFTDFVLALGYHGALIKRYFLEYDWRNRDFTLNLEDHALRYHTPSDVAGWRVTFAETGLHTQTGARLLRAARYVDAPRFFATYADGVADVDLRALLAFHEAQGALATLTGVRPFSRFGVIRDTGEGRVAGFAEKPLVDDLINGGFFVLEREVLPYLEGEDDVVLERDPLRRLAADGQLALYEHDGFWRAMDTFKDNRQLNELWENGAPWKVWR